MLYIKFTKDYLEYFEKKSEMSNFLKKVIYTYKKIFGKITKIKKDKGEVWLIPNNNLRFKKKVLKNIKIFQNKTVVLSNNLDNFREDLEKINVNILNGKWLHKYLILDIVKYICESKNEKLEEQTISFVIKEPQDIDFQNLSILAKSCKNINLITKEDYKFKRLENTLYTEQGIIVNTSYNYKKSLLKSGIIINIDIGEKEFNKFAFPRKSIIVNLEDVQIYNKGFNGINVLKYEINFPDKYKDEILNLDNFNKEILYESYIYKKTSPQNILKEINKDGVKLTHLIGKNGYIDKREYLKI